MAMSIERRCSWRPRFEIGSFAGEPHFLAAAGNRDWKSKSCRAAIADFIN